MTAGLFEVTIHNDEKKMNNFLTRTITGALFVAVMVFCIWYSYWTMAGLFFVISILGLWEFYSLLEKANYYPQKYIGLIIGAGILISIHFKVNFSFTIPLFTFF